ncbi:hypothetical protein Hamer_G021893 [Homarus americanus]|uniref:Uncharacterized protein n=1 Tax=Homarus americanus TaxID=6706 RepID=A0A8J5TL64_HOMAM|nr:hypothetical protein Hamer_G021893 [Homarus americanus]
MFKETLVANLDPDGIGIGRRRGQEERPCKKCV